MGKLKEVSEILKRIDNNILVKRREHIGYKEMKKIESETTGSFYGKYQYIYTSNKGEISLVRLKDLMFKSVYFWGIFELSNNNLFQDVERFKTKKIAKVRIAGLLG